MDRDEFLARVGRSSMTGELPAPPEVRSELPVYESDDLVALFRTRAQKVNAVVHGPLSRHGAPRAVVAIATGHEASRFMAWDDVGAPGVLAALTAEGLERVDEAIASGHRIDRTVAYHDVEVGVTGADAGLAESGSLVMTHGPGRPRMASLIPEIHIALLDVTAITSTLAHWAAKNPGFVADTANLVIVTGPSRTGDIEQHLNLGVHGPRHVHIVLIK